MKSPEEASLEELLGRIRCLFYARLPEKRWHQERSALVKALTWPAHWMNQHGVTVSQPRYRLLLEERIGEIAVHSDPKRRDDYFPAYLLKCLQEYFARHGEALYEELKHIRSALYGWEISLEVRERSRQENTEIEAMARTHRLLTVKAKAKAKKRARRNSPEQLELF